jgi:hypothetical protein
VAQYKAYSETVEVLGQSILSIVSGMDLVKPRALRILALHGIDPLIPGNWYQQQACLNAFKAIFDKIGPNTLRAIGRKIPENAAFPPEINTIEKGLASIDVAYHMNHRNGEIGNYRYQQLTPRSAQLVCNNPYPCDMDLGLIEAISDRFRPKDSLRVRLEHDKGPCRTQSGDVCSYTVSW